MKHFFSVLLSLLLSCSLLQAGPADEVSGAMAKLKQERAALLEQLKRPGAQLEEIISKMLDLGLWQQAGEALEKPSSLSPADRGALQARLLILNNDFQKAEDLLKEVLNQEPAHLGARRQMAVLSIEAWKLAEAEELCRALLKENPADQKTSIVLGRALLLQKKYPQALSLAKQLQKADPGSAPAYLLEADVYFWDQQPEKAEAPLITSLELNPFDADARFSYGYAIWRRVDATQLNAMAAQWELALQINPLHFSTHWHWGNGHTNLTFADYADPDEKEIRAALELADTLFSNNQLPEALERIHSVAEKFPQSVLPAMHEASLLYSDFESPSRQQELQQAQELFREILNKKAHYGPAHNGLAAVIKSKRISYLSNFDSITRVLKNLQIDDPVNFSRVFPDMDYYPGQLVRAMVWNQLFTSVVYFPFLSKQGNSFVIPPLHNDLAIAMNSPFFRSSTTFDNRQWMDIRGVGSGAADIGYTERGAYFERNVVLHEYVHLFHGRVLTDQENRQIRALYYHAMENNLTLDYYSQNNESEYFAQTYPAYFEPMKVHPLDFKSMNTTADLKQKDPDMYAFLDALVEKERAYLQGDHQRMASNWAQVYINLSRKVGRSESALAAAYLDTALQHDEQYLPAYIAYAQLKEQQRDFSAAEGFLQAAQGIDETYAPVYAALAALRQQQYLQDTTFTQARQAQIDLLEKAISLEQDYQTAAGLHLQLRKVYEDFGELREAIGVAERYGKSGPTVSTYLRDRVNEAVAYAAANRALLGDFSQVEALGRLVDRNPQNYNFRALYSDALYAMGAYEKSIENMQAAQRILSSSGNGRADFDLRIAESLLKLERGSQLEAYLKPLAEQSKSFAPDLGLRLALLLHQSGQPQPARQIFNDLPRSGTPAYMKNHRNVEKQLL